MWTRKIKEVNMSESQELVRELNDGERALLESGRDLVFVGITVKLPDDSETSEVTQALFVLSELVEDMRLSALSRLRLERRQPTGKEETIEVGELLSMLTPFHLRSVTYGTPLETIFVCAAVTAMGFALEKMAGGYFEEIGKRLASSDDREQNHPKQGGRSRPAKYVRSLRILGVEVFTYKVERREGRR